MTKFPTEFPAGREFDPQTGPDTDRVVSQILSSPCEQDSEFALKMSVVKRYFADNRAFRPTT
jgi:hypothetical protein